MVKGLRSFQEWFHGYEEQYTIIGGTACDLLMSAGGLDFRATKDIDLVLIIEAVTPEFGKHFWGYVIQAGYEHRNKSTGEPQFYRFSRPKNEEYPFMIELFTRRTDAVKLPENAVLTPLHMDDELSSLSAILLSNEYYEFLLRGRVRSNGITILDAGYLIPFKAKAWIDLTDRKSAGEKIDSKNIRKHKNDILRLSALLGQNTKVNVTPEIYRDIQVFLEAMSRESADTKQLGLTRTGDEILEILRNTYLKSEQQ